MYHFFNIEILRLFFDKIRFFIIQTECKTLKLSTLSRFIDIYEYIHFSGWFQTNVTIFKENVFVTNIWGNLDRLGYATFKIRWNSERFAIFLHLPLRWEPFSQSEKSFFGKRKLALPSVWGMGRNFKALSRETPAQPFSHKQRFSKVETYCTNFILAKAVIPLMVISIILGHLFVLCKKNTLSLQK